MKQKNSVAELSPRLVLKVQRKHHLGLPIDFRITYSYKSCEPVP